MKTIDPVCGKSWGGFRAEHCAGCHETFSGTTAGDKHRIGKHHDGTRRCMTEVELQGALAYDADRDVWRLPDAQPPRPEWYGWSA